MTIEDIEKHHPLCNYFALPFEKCKMCKGLYDKYPKKEGEDRFEHVNRVMEENFPEAIKIR